MVRIDTIRESNAKCKDIHELVAVFVGGTGGIGESTAKELFLRTTKPRAYIIGRNDTQGNAICNELHEMNPEGQAIFIQRDISTLKNVDELCKDLQQREPKINCLFLTAGYMTLRGRNETVEGIDRKMAVNYYSRMRCIENLMPCLEKASQNNELSRVITVLAAGSEGDVRVDDLDLKHNFTLHACLAHCVVMTDFFIGELAKHYPGTSFSHSYPGTVKSGIANELSGPVRLAVKVMYAVMTPWILNVRESGERHLFQITSQCYPSRQGGVGIPIPEGLSAMRAIDGEVGGGAYLLDWDGKSTGDESVLQKYREIGIEKIVWEHTHEIFVQADKRMRKDSKRVAQDEAEGAGRPIPNPLGWRPAS
ncbi:Putative short-chain dehydrogenase/reductase SDR, NAD(P)-binding domain superfamily [Septoria linicola]|uniref:Short-chain dehydrogenase/reductase SDR, NAD(P)-binding domain superfamily n=1 Tax=Septoria linicola TaxID=215465 RepID=A0A9Q9EIT6_9PEZI|nr:putative short-chain dehydrogenase/reductase SDR, NAD(P)-binding domain superfamily [Septoria linicola]USW51449.1 Putative short-chain dehydrogenase/reductase SDR, NAD(P)-binding domain superfamily [Septoria linicola]